MGATDTAAFAVPVAVMLILAIVAAPCIYMQVAKKRRQKRLQARKERELGSTIAIELPEVVRRTNVPTNPSARLPETSPTVRNPEPDLESGITIPPYTSADVQPLSSREQELVTQMNAMAEKIRELEEERSRSRPPDYQSGSSQPVEAEAGIVERTDGNRAGEAVIPGATNGVTVSTS
ncbi:hypothetical protein L218DRAFT_1080577 [Marasmius fiardii PR-910]|nr:hypothetical protein L218DRAFT_1080577 [Marasmius fiardii PR-910]